MKIEKWSGHEIRFVESDGEWWAVSIKHGYPKMIKKADMRPEMLKDRELILTDTVELMTLKNKYGLDVSVSDVIYKKTS